MPGATLTLGCNQFTPNPPPAGVSVAKVSDGNFSISTTTGISPLVVQTSTASGQSLSSHTVTFKTALGTVSVDTTRSANGADTGDRITFEKNVASATVIAGKSSSSGSGDRVEFQGSLGSNSQVVTGSCSDTVTFVSSSVQGTLGKDLVKAGAGADSISFNGTTKVGTNIVIDFGADSSGDILRGAAKATFQSAGLQIRNFGSGDKVIVAGNTFTNQSQINNYFGDSGQSIRLV